MINHNYKVIFIHIPKCAGSSVEFYFNVKPFDWKEPNYTNLTGWCPKRKIHLHHATSSELLNLDLIEPEIWHTYTKFSIIRNPWSRAVSDYFWLMKDSGKKDSFKNFILKKGKFKGILNDRSSKYFRGDHLYSQTDYLYINGVNQMDEVLRFENLKEDFSGLVRKMNWKNDYNLPHSKKGEKKYKHYSHFYSTKKRELIKDKYFKDISNFDYHFDDRRAELPFINNLLLNFKK